VVHIPPSSGILIVTPWLWAKDTDDVIVTTVFGMLFVVALVCGRYGGKDHA
jgi:hypothetical protein